MDDNLRVGSGEWGVGNGEWGMGSGEWGMGNGVLGTCTERTRRASCREAVGAASRREVLGIIILPLLPHLPYSLLPTPHSPLPTPLTTTDIERVNLCEF
ncbi:hypothetical protein [Nostoc sp.]|uniref:hypothetical protein n=1 Tax=Nostoc sp. TaxID=1180 RepID=UPI002FFAEDB1